MVPLGFINVFLLHYVDEGYAIVKLYTVRGRVISKYNFGGCAVSGERKEASECIINTIG